MRKGIFSVTHRSILHHELPQAENENVALPPAPSIVEVTATTNHFNESVSSLSQASTGGELSFSSPLTTKDHDIPSTPEGRPIVRIDEEMIEVGYDSDHQQAPWETIQEEDYAVQTLEEEELPDGPPAVSSEGEVSENMKEKN